MRKLRSALLGSLLLLCASCGGEDPVAVTPGPVQEIVPSFSANLPIPPLDPGHAAPPRSGSATDVQFDSSNVFGYSDNGETGDKGNGTFAVLPGGNEDLDSAWAVFKMQLASDDRPVSIDLGSAFATLPGGEDDLELSYWLSAYSFSDQRWEWLAPPSGSADPLRSGAWNARGTVDVGLNSEELRERFCNLGGEVYVAIVVEPKVLAGAYCGVTIEPSTLHFLNKADPAFFKCAPLSSGVGATTGSSQSSDITVPVAPDASGEADRIYVERRESSGVSSARIASTAGWVVLGFTGPNGANFKDPGNKINDAAGDPQEDVTYEYRTVAAALDGYKVIRAKPSPPVKGMFGWSKLTVDDSSGADVGTFSSMAVVQGRPAIAYADVSNNRILYIRANDAEGASWPGTPVAVCLTPGGCQGLSMAVISATDMFPAIAFCSGLPNKQLNFVRAKNNLGTAWDPVQAVDQTADVGYDCDLKVIGTTPAIAYADGGNGGDRTLRYISAPDPLGMAWDAFTVVTIVVAPGDVQDPSLTEVIGRPAIAYYDSGADELRYIYYDTSWTGPQTLASAIGSQTANPCMMLHAGVTPSPMVAFNKVGGGLYVVHANDTQGSTAWGAPIQLDAAGGEFCSMQLVNSKPAIAYRHLNGELAVVASKDGVGVSQGDWTLPKVIDGDNGELAGMYSSLIDLANRPAVSYYGDTTGILRYARLH